MNESSLAGRVVIVTGAGRGIGRECALLMAREGARLVVNDVGTSLQGEGQDGAVAQAVVDEIRRQGGQAIASQVDVSRPDSGDQLVDAALQGFGRIDAVVNNAGIMRGKPFCEMDEASWDLVLKVNLNGAFYLSRAAAPHFVRQRSGAFVHMTSSAALIGAVNQANYAVSKNGVAALSRSLSLEMQAHGVRSNCVAPLAFSRMTIGATGRSEDDPIVRKQREIEGAAAVAPLVAYLASDASRQINGQVIGVRGNEVYLYSQPRPIRVLHEREGWSLDRLAQTLAPAWQSALTPVERTRDVFTWDVGSSSPLRSS